MSSTKPAKKVVNKALPSPPPPISIGNAAGLMEDLIASPAISADLRRVGRVVTEVIDAAEFAAHLHGNLPFSLLPPHYKALIHYFACAEALAGTPSGNSRKLARARVEAARSSVYRALNREVPV